MIRLQRGRPPESLDTPEKEQALGEHFEQYRSTRPWRAADILAALFLEAHEKCVYCESLLGSIDNMQVDHFIPKNEKPLLAATWSNLNCSCADCNRLKVVGPAYVNPYEDEPAQHFFYSGSRLHAITEEGRATLKRLRLGSRLSGKHDVVWEGIVRLVETLHHKLDRVVGGELDEVLKADIWSDAVAIVESGTPEKEFSAVMASQLLQYSEWERAEQVLRHLKVWDAELERLDVLMRLQALPIRRPA
ncbi:HNH endonuclease signature motif containing protein [Deinococcus sp. QL22]|uniref:HNH endonuclease signature motif containing protein n=1 Tax=Deinococcus sp. QL22 TaxID=2939437 RepID=UPI002016B27B|nr:HNH endonuclease signature motif containing protein [Deinococcus sp. QL22]UQN06259.1 HNH endonuclease [Deinococcus sp. QL22]